FRVDEAGCYSVRQDVARAQLPGDRFGEADQTGLAGSVVRLPLVAVDSDDARDVDHAAPATLHHAARRCADRDEGAAQIRVDDRVPVVVLDAHQEVVARESGVVYENVDSAKRRLHIRHESCNCRNIADVRGEATRAAADLRCNRLTALQVTPHDSHARSALGERIRDRTPDAARAASDQCVSPGKIDLNAHPSASASLSTSAGAPTAMVRAPGTICDTSPPRTLPGPSSTYSESGCAAAMARTSADHRTGEVNCRSSSARASSPLVHASAVTLV